MRILIKCKNSRCGKWTSKNTKNITKSNHKCFYCGVGGKIKRKDEFGFNFQIKNISESMSPLDIALCVSKLNGVGMEDGNKKGIQ